MLPLAAKTHAGMLPIRKPALRIKTVETLACKHRCLSEARH